MHRDTAHEPARSVRRAGPRENWIPRPKRRNCWRNAKAARAGSVDASRQQGGWAPAARAREQAMDAADPTNANAVAGPSRVAYAAGPATAALSAARDPPTATRPPHPGQSRPASAADDTGTASTARREPVRRAGGPVIVPTRVDPDNVRVVPQQFEHCQLDDLISLIGESSFFLSGVHLSGEGLLTLRRVSAACSFDAGPPHRTQ